MSFTPSVGTFQNFRDKYGNDVGMRPVPMFINVHNLTGGSAVSDTVPSAANLVIISADVNIFVNCNGTASTSGATDGSGSELNPGGYALMQGNMPTSISIIGEANGNVTLSYYRV